MRKNIIIIILVLIILGISGGFIYFFQQNQLILNELKKQSYIENQRNAGSQTHSSQQDELSGFQILKEEDIKKTVKEIIGEVIQIADNFIIKNNKIFDLARLNGVGNSSKTVPLKNKEFKVIIGEKTYFLDSQKFSDIRIGDRIQAFSTFSIYNIDEFIAIEIFNLSRLEVISTTP